MSWCHRLIAHDWLLSVCRPHPATSFTFVFDRFYGHCASRQRSRITRAPYLFRTLALPHRSHPLPLARARAFLFFPRSPHSHARHPPVRFGIDAAADIGRGAGGTGGKKNRERVKLCPRRGRSDRFIAATADGRSSARRVSFLRFSPARPLPATLSPTVIRDLRRDGRAPRGFNREITLTYRNPSTGLKLKAESYVAPGRVAV